METLQTPLDGFSPSHEATQTTLEDATAPEQTDAPTTGDEFTSETTESTIAKPEDESEGVVMIPLNQIFIDNSIFVRAAWDHYTVERYAAALIRKEPLPPITVEAVEEEYRILKGFHRFEAYCLRQSICTGKVTADFYDEPLPSFSDAELNNIPCIIGTIPPETHPLLIGIADNLKNGKPLTPEDYKKVARQLYKDYEGAPINGLAKLIRIDRKTFKAYVADLVEAFEAKRETIIRDLHAQGASNQEISDELKEQFRHAKGNKKSQVGETVSKIETQAQSVEEEAAPDTGETDPPSAPPVDIAQDRQDPPEAAQEEQESEPAEPETQHEAPTPIMELKVLAGTSGNTITILGVHSLPDHLQDRLRKAVDELVEQVRTEAEKDKEQEDDSNETGSPDTVEHDRDNDEDTNNKDEPAKPDNEIRKFVPAIQSSRGSRPVIYHA
jgi:hypothetical protein